MTDGTRRATPADPTPHLTTQEQARAALIRNLPPDLGPGAVGLVEGSSFMYSDAVGDVKAGTIGGLVHDDTRFLNRWELTLNEVPLLILDSGEVDYYSAAFFLTNPELPGLQANLVGVRRTRFIDGGMHERIDVQCFARHPLSIRLRLAVGSDFADIFEIKRTVRDRSAQITRLHTVDGSMLLFCYRNGSFEAETRVEANPAASRVEGDDLVWDVDLQSNCEWHVELDVPLRLGTSYIKRTHRQFDEVSGSREADTVARWRPLTPTLRTESADLKDLLEKTKLDLAALEIERLIRSKKAAYVAAGVPWFLALFGRDSLIAAYQTMSAGPFVAQGALLALAEQQGTRVNDDADEQPGKILHEVRYGELTKIGVLPFDPYYGSADATQLWLIVLSEYWRWTGDPELLHALRDHAYAALAWIDDYGDLDGDGFVEYATKSIHGLGNQCWRDSFDGILFTDGTLPPLPIATCEVQGYAYDAKLRFAELADGPYKDPGLARRLRADAQALYERFNRDFWIDDRGGFYAVGLDGDKRQIDTMTSNMGHLLWSGIVPASRARAVADQLMSDNMFSGWGVRTTSAADAAYNPIGYHMGTVWPHDNSIIAHGLGRYGFRDEANRIILAMLDAAKFFNYRLPEAFSGYARSFSRKPVPYPTACSPETWASSAPHLFIRTLLGIEASNGELSVNPDLPERIRSIQLIGFNAFRKRWDIEAAGRESSVRPSSLPYRTHPEE